MSVTSNTASNLYASGVGTSSTSKFSCNAVTYNRAPATTDIQSRSGLYPLGQTWIDTTNEVIYALASFSSSGGTVTANWVVLGGDSAAVDSLAGDSGTATPSSGEITVAGTAGQITTTAVNSAVTLSIPSAFVAPGSITATLGDITATNGNIVRGTAGNKDIYSSVASNATAGANSAGTVLLVNGTVTVNTTAVTANSLIRLNRITIGGTSTNALGALAVANFVPGTSFDIFAANIATASSIQTDDQSSVFWEIVN